MKRFPLSMLIVGIAFCSCPVWAADPGPESRDGVFIHLSQGAKDPHRVLMALNMAVLMAEDHPVLVYFDIDAISLVLKDAPDLKYAHFPPLKTQLAKLARQGATLMACPGCLKAAGKTVEDLGPGIRVAEKTTFFSFTKGRILTLDY